ncbi:MAG: hypothetical protein ACYC8T_18930 [Myxococcaceae bacterium]
MTDFAEKQCLQYRLAGVEALGKGPLIVCLDRSGSMAGFELVEERYERDIEL